MGPGPGQHGRYLGEIKQDDRPPGATGNILSSSPKVETYLTFFAARQEIMSIILSI